MEELASRVASALAAYLAGASTELQFREQLATLSQQPQATAPVPPADVSPDTVTRVFDYWRKATGHTRARKTPERVSRIKARLKQGYTERDIMRAIEGCVSSDFHSEGGYNSIELICRNGEKLEEFMAKSGPVITEQDEQLDLLKTQARSAMQRGDNETYNRLNTELARRIQATTQSE